MAPSDTVEAVKLMLLDRECIPPAQQRLVRGGTQLADRTLADCGVVCEGTLFLVLRLPNISSTCPFCLFLSLLLLLLLLLLRFFVRPLLCPEVPGLPQRAEHAGW